MTTNGSRSTTNCPDCAAAEAAVDVLHSTVRALKGEAVHFIPHIRTLELERSIAMEALENYQIMYAEREQEHAAAVAEAAAACAALDSVAALNNRIAAENQALVTEVAALREQAWRIYNSFDLAEEHAARQQDAALEQMLDILEDPSPAVAALERRLAQLRAQLEQAHDELDAVDEALGEFYCPVLDENDEPCGAFFKDHGVNVMRQALEQAKALAELVPEADLLNYLGGCAFLVAAMKELHSDPYGEVEKFGKAARALAARIKDARREQEEGE